MASLPIPNDSGVNTNNDGNNTAPVPSPDDSGVNASKVGHNTSLVFPVGINQASFIKYTSPNDLFDRVKVVGQLNPDTLIMQSVNISRRRDLPIDQEPHMNQEPSRIGKLKHKMRGMSKKQSIPYIRNYMKEKKLRLAASLSNIEEVIALLEMGVNPNCSDDYQRSALHLAASRGYPDIVTQLLKYGAKPNLQDSLGNTPLHLAVCSASSFNFNMVVRILLKHGASVHASDRNGKNPLDLVNSKLTLMRMRRDKDTSPESSKILLDLSVLTTLLLHTYVKETQCLDIDSLEERLQKLSTNEIEDEADMLLAKVERLRITQ